ncbi:MULTISPECIES: methionyl-tRNA formyltransferase [unclassified Pseudodesulfovibrio]|uniref:methionyl-tRNA formyltransferase n=1 Tax=unclassified Pseudodesulfovibrio TaxID=2661612 RepID=UPI000FEBDAFB|nr:MULTISPECIES: methionyl-tRNA formyltransferase [unclassified Pseudodesulfovibrio]MCJ2165576.1 methionyl-tRNA formyltransferase [Pseudodesulfovibrio sp. S3-i]RWU03064.1 methionyl-tRNA formyltransferase [Pseudodesulfovibrio sp. S3]
MEVKATSTNTPEAWGAVKLKPLRTVFMGTPDFAAEALSILLKFDAAELVGIYTQPDRPCGRGQQCKPSPVKVVALENDIPVFQPVNFKDRADIDQLARLKPDVLVVAAYGLILPQSVLDIPVLHPLNIHASLLPQWRGAAPIQRAIENGDVVTGISIMKMEAGLDTGPVMVQRALRIGHNDHAGTIHDELAKLGGICICEALARLQTGAYDLKPQDNTIATYAKKLEKKEGGIDWNRPAKAIHNQIRAMYPWPGAFFDWTNPEGKTIRLNVSPGMVSEESAPKVAPGTILGEMDGHLGIVTADKIYLTPEVKPQGKKAMDATAFSCGYMKECK